ncbi:MAG: hypothetical protein WKG01_20200 [Kofleriaceae bacterium]
MSRVLVGVACMLALAGEANANGRAPGTRSILFRRGTPSHVVAGMTFGALLSEDNGRTWHWMCEDAIGYGGIYDPSYTFTPSGAVFATTFSGIKVLRDRCVFGATELGTRFVSTLNQGTDSSLFAGMVDLADGKLYRSRDDGLTFPVGTMPGMLNDWWSTIEAAPSDPNRVYASGYRLNSGQPKQFLLYRSTNAGASFSPLPITDFVTRENSTLEIVGVSHTNPNLVFARVTLEDNSISDAIYRSTDGGLTWTRVFGKRGAIAFVVRANGALVAGTQVRGSFVSIDNGLNWAQLPNAPHINCLVENPAGEVWACTQNFGMVGVPSDGFGIMKSTDLLRWSGVLKYQNIEGPATCGAGTVQKDKCDVQLWCGLCDQLGCDPKRECPRLEVPLDGASEQSPDGCCGAGSQSTNLALALLVGMVLLKQRRRGTAC